MHFWMKSFSDELMKISGIVGTAGSFVKKNIKPLAYFGGGVGATLLGKRLVQNQIMAEQVRRQMRGQ